MCGTEDRTRYPTILFALYLACLALCKAVFSHTLTLFYLVFREAGSDEQPSEQEQPSSEEGRARLNDGSQGVLSFDRIQQNWT